MDATQGFLAAVDDFRSLRNYKGVAFCLEHLAAIVGMVGDWQLSARESGSTQANPIKQDGDLFDLPSWSQVALLEVGS